MNDSQITAELERLELELMDPKLREPVLLNTEWASGMPNEAGVYAWFDGDELIYVGETGLMAKRMGDARRTVNHTLRRSIGADRFSGESGYEPATSKNKFPTAIEERLDGYMKTLSVAALVVKFGRTELEEHVVDKHNPKYNSKKRRGS